MAQPSLHPAVDNGIAQGASADFSGGTLYCKCPTDKVAVEISGNVEHNHVCGCSKCWKPDGALFSLVGVVPADKMRVTAHEEKLKPVDSSAAIIREACSECGTHMYGHIEKDHPFKGLNFVHVELSDQKGWQPPQFAAFVSSIIEQGYQPEGMEAVRGKLHSAGLESYDCLSPPLMDLIAGFSADKAGTAYKEGQGRPGAAASEPEKKEGGITGFINKIFGS